MPALLTPFPSKARDKAYRDQYLLSLTELFAHFIEDEGGHMAKAKAAGRRKIHGLDDDDEYGAKSPDQYLPCHLYC